MGLLVALIGLARGASWTGWTGPIWTSEPFLLRRGVQLGLEFAPAPEFALWGTVQVFPNLGEADYKQVTLQLIQEANVAPDLSRMTGGTNLGFAYYPLHAQRGQVSSRVGFHAGFGVVHTVDDLEALQVSPSDPIYANTAVEWHGACSRGLTSDVYLDIVGLHLAMDRLRTIETVGGTSLELKDYRVFSIGISVRTP